MFDGWTFSLLGYKARLLHPEYGLLLVAVFVAGMLLFLSSVTHAARVRRIIPTRLMPKVLPGYSPARRYLRLGSGLFASLLISLSLMQPQCGSGTELARKVGIDVVVALDVSRSMLARDVKPSRLARARLELTDLIDHLDGDRFGLVIFAGSAFVQCPMTTDYAAAKLFLRAVDAGQMPSQGTNISAALGAAGELLGSREGARGKVVILLTDGEDHSGRAQEAAKKLAEAGARIFTVGIGSPSGEPIPIVSKHGDIIGYKKDASGNTILSRLDTAALEQLAEAGEGTYVAAGTSGAGIDQVIERMEEMEKTEFEARLTTRYADQSAVFLVPAFFFLLLSLGIRPGSRSSSLLPFFLLLSVPLLGGWRLLESEDPAVVAGNQAYQQGSYDDAVKAYDEALGRMQTPGERSQVQFNKGTALAAKGEMEAARTSLQAALAGADDGLKATDLYNLGTGLLTTGDPKGASDAFIRSLQIDPANAAARHNLELALRALKPEENPQKQDSDSSEKEQEKDQSEQSEKDSPEKQEKEQAEKQEEQEGKGEESQDEKDSEGEQQDESEGQSQEQQQDAEQEGQSQEQQEQEGQQGEEQQQEQQSGEGEQQEQEGQPEEGKDQEQDAEQQEQEQSEGEGGREEEQETGDPTEVSEAGEEGEGGDQKGPVKGAIASEEAERILDALSRGEKPLQMQLFRVGEYKDDESQTGGKDW